MRVIFLVAGLVLAGLVLPFTAGAASILRSVDATYYGAYDNDPPGSTAIAHPVIHQHAGGAGAYTDPSTFASPDGAGAYPWGTVIYVPYVQKYFIREDECAASWTAPLGCGPVDRVDLYVGNPSDSRAVLACENALTTNGPQQIIVDPPPALVVDSQPIWNQATGTCMTPHDSTALPPAGSPGPLPTPRHRARFQ